MAIGNIADREQGSSVRSKLNQVIDEVNADGLKLDGIEDEATKTSRKNYLINPRLEINQRAFSGGALTAGVYGFDRWKARTGDANLARSGDVTTLTSGGIEQVIESPHLESKTITISALAGTGTITGHVDGAVTSTSGTLPLTVTLVSGDTGNITIGVSGTSVTFEGIQTETASVATDFEYRPIGEEQALCERYFQIFGGTTFHRFASGKVDSANDLQAPFLPIQQMRTTPTLTTTGNFRVENSAGNTAVTSLSIVFDGLAANTASATNNSVGVLSANNDTTARIKLDAEL